MAVALVTDSTANLPAPMVAYWGITVVPVQVIAGDKAYDEGVDISPAAVAGALRSGTTVTTSRPSPARFTQAYRAAAAAGAESVLSVHLSADLSGTYDAALLAAADAPLPVRVVDSRSVSMGLGYGVIAAARELAQGRDVDAAVAAVSDTCTRTRVLFYVDSLDYLRRGGRIGAAQRWIGSALSMKPILHLAKGRVQPLEKVRTANKALARLEELAVESAGEQAVEIAVLHLDAAARAGDLAERLGRRLPQAQVLEGEVGAVVAVHVGPGMVAVVVSPVRVP